MAEGRHCKHGLHVAEGCTICFGSESKIWRGTVLGLAYELGRDIEPEWMHDKDGIVCLPATDYDALAEARAEIQRREQAGELLDVHAICDQRDKAVQERDALMLCVEVLINTRNKYIEQSAEMGVLRAENERLRAELANLQAERNSPNYEHFD